MHSLPRRRRRSTWNEEIFQADVRSEVLRRQPFVTLSRACGARQCGSGGVRLSTTQYGVSFGSGAGAAVLGWPSKGGIYVLRPSLAVELDFLGLDRFQDAKRANSSSDEELHCNKMRQLGVVWWEYEGDYRFSLIDDTWRYNSTSVKVGWPATGGVWVSKDNGHGSKRKGRRYIHNAYDMEERCTVIERLGGVFYADPKDCPDLDLA
ncbi:hypothetical protein TOPH_07235 [Tolypocladium ophioglossoides CBS 100239]|uniref:Uncharacterized protein n=1 Tax=Tolypocladium ophioglossoides (strain CBS 100239) TaxID=1163406 RepID=A0A0L0N2A3_TOLOC|nr:hypothetical protein TOPH_07235 [Tolypocladium ophioglossoides CBS 100239]